MASILDPIIKAIHDSAVTLLDQQVPTKLANSVNSFVTAGFDVATNVLTIVRDLTTPAAPPPGP